MSNEIAKVKQETRLQTSHNILTAIEKFSEARALELDDYQKLCGVNALTVISNLSDDINDFPRDNVISTVQNLMYLRLNPANAEVALTTRYKGKQKTVEMSVMGVGYDALLRNFGVNVLKVHEAWLIREKDQYVPQEFVGIKATEPRWKRGEGSKEQRGKVVRIVYPVELKDGEVIYLEGDREDVKISLIAQAKQNMMKASDKQEAERILREMEELSIDVLISDPKWRDKTIKTKKFDNENKKWLEEDVKIFNDTYTGHSRENMLERKMRNHAIRKYPKNLDNILVREAYESTYEEERYNKSYVLDAVEETQGKLVEEVRDKANSVTVEDTIPEVVLVEPTKPIVKQTKSTESPKVELQIVKEEPKEKSSIDDDLEGMFD
jgi:hypothetical protein